MLDKFVSTKEDVKDERKKWRVFADGLLLYFDKSLPTLLLYKSERPQYASYFSSHSTIAPSQVYGLEHFCRMLIKLPYLLSSTETATEGEVKSLLSKVGELSRWISKEEGGRGIYRKPKFDEMGVKELKEKEKNN